MDATTVLFVSDTHINSTASLCNPRVKVDQGSYTPSRTQKEIWRNWQTMIEQVEAAKRGRLISVFCGDMVEADKKQRTYQVINRNQAEILEHAAEVLEPIAKLSEKLYWVRGTSAHTGKGGCLEEDLAADFDNTVKLEKSHSVYWLPLEVAGVRFDISHHTSMGGKLVTQKTAAIRYAKDVQDEYVEAGAKIPHLIIRAHVHRWADSESAWRQTRAIFLPCWSSSIEHEYVQKIHPGAVGQWGALLVHCAGGKYEIQKIEFEEPRKLWVKA